MCVFPKTERDFYSRMFTGNVQNVKLHTRTSYIEKEEKKRLNLIDKFFYPCKIQLFKWRFHVIHRVIVQFQDRENRGLK